MSVVSRRRSRQVFPANDSSAGAGGSTAPTILCLATSSLVVAFEEACVPELTAPAALEKLRPLGYRGGVTIVRARLRLLQPRL